MFDLGRKRHETLKILELDVTHPSISLLIKEDYRELANDIRTIGSRPKMHRPLIALRGCVAKIDLGEWRMVSARKRRLRAALFLEIKECELDVLAGPEFVGGVVRTGAIVITRIQPADDHPICTARIRIGDFELGKKRFMPDILQPEILLSTKLTTQSTLPFHPGEVFRGVAA